MSYYALSHEMGSWMIAELTAERGWVVKMFAVLSCRLLHSLGCEKESQMFAELSTENSWQRRCLPCGMCTDHTILQVIRWMVAELITERDWWWKCLLCGMYPDQVVVGSNWHTIGHKLNQWMIAQLTIERGWLRRCLPCGTCTGQGVEDHSIP